MAGNKLNKDSADAGVGKNLLRVSASGMEDVWGTGGKIALSMMEGLQGRVCAMREGRMGSAVLQSVPVAETSEDAKNLRWDADSGHDVALAVLGVSYLVKGDDRRYGALALAFLSKAAEKNNALACYALAFCAERGYGRSKDEGEARQMYQRALESWLGMEDEEHESRYGCGLRALGCGECYAKGEGVAQDMKKAAEWFEKSAEQGNAVGQWLLGGCYANGEGVAQDMKKAAEWFEKSAEQENADGQLLLGLCYANGEGVAQDKEKAAELYLKSAEQGDADGQRLLGCCYANGDGVEQDMKKTAEWFEKSAEQGNAAGQRLLGLCYAKGEGVAQDMQKAAEWYRKAAEQGDEEAKKSYQRIQGNGKHLQ